MAYHGARAQDAEFNITLDRELDRNLAGIELAPQETTWLFLNLFVNGGAKPGRWGGVKVGH